MPEEISRISGSSKSSWYSLLSIKEQLVQQATTGMPFAFQARMRSAFFFAFSCASSRYPEATMGAPQQMKDLSVMTS